MKKSADFSLSEMLTEVRISEHYQELKILGVIKPKKSASFSGPRKFAFSWFQRILR
ncbi:MAG: hypothetical protein NT076_01545 [Candidatus Pacearchaeota archaeon]|nr:hypothetical protein [Candidatus Pacearchaeota archaeon]